MQGETKQGEASRMDRFKPREDRFAFIVALGRTFISLQERSPDDLSTTDNVERGPQQPFFSEVPLEQWRKGAAV